MIRLRRKIELAQTDFRTYCIELRARKRGAPPRDRLGGQREDGRYTVKVGLPDVEQADIDISVRDDMLVIAGETRDERRDEGEENGKTRFFSERRYGAFRRAFRLPMDVQQEDIAADFEDGVLALTLPGADAPDQERKIEIV